MLQAGLIAGVIIFKQQRLCGSVSRWGVGQLLAGGNTEVMDSIAIGPDSITWKRVKTGVPKTESISVELKKYIAHLPLGIQRVVPWKNERTYNTHFTKVLKAAGMSDMGLSPHKFRHILADHLLSKGVDIKTISEILGHSSINVTSQSYAHLRDSTKRDALSKIGKWGK